MLTKFQQHLNDTTLLPLNSKLLVAVSGGVDSMSLLHLLSQLAEFYNWQIAVAHYDHKVRADSHKDAELVGVVAEKLGHKYYLDIHQDSQKTEAELRRARYEFLESTRQHLNYDFIVTAHHLGDRIETAIFNVIRGADRKGVNALKARRDAIVRPLLPFSKAELITYANLKKLPYREDSTNTDINFTRNFVRHELVPNGTQLYRNFHHAFTKSLSELELINSRIDANLDVLIRSLLISSNSNTFVLDKKTFRNLPSTIGTEIIAHIVRILQPGVMLSKKNLAEAKKYLYTASVGTHKHFKSGLHLGVSYDSLKLTRENSFAIQEDSNTLHLLTEDSPFENEHFTVSIASSAPQNAKYIVIAPQKLYVRYRNASDKIEQLGMKGRKKLQDLFVDRKVPSELRSKWPIVVNAKNEIIWVCGLAVNKNNPADKKSSNNMYIISKKK